MSQCDINREMANAHLIKILYGAVGCLTEFLTVQNAHEEGRRFKVASIVLSKAELETFMKIEGLPR